MRKKMTKSCSLALAAVMTLSFVPVYHNTVKAENEDVQMEGTSKEVLDELRLSSTQVSLGDEGENPYSENSDTVINMFPRMELMMRDNVNDDSDRGRTIVYNYDKTESGSIWDNEEFSYTVEDAVYSTNSVGVDIDFNGKKDHAARISVTKNNGRSVFKLYIEDYTGKRLKTVDLGEFDQNIYNDGFNQLAQLQITAGDYDGDGGDEVAVGVKGEVIVYDVYINNGGDIELNEIRRINNSELVSVPTESTNTYREWPQTQLTSGDITGDNRDELIITAGYKSGLGTAKITPRTNIYSQKKGETELTKKAEFEHAWNYTLYDSENDRSKTQRGAYGSSAVGDIDGDGAEELILASYDLNSDTDNDDTSLYQQKTLLGIVEYENGEFVAGAGGVGQSKSTHPALAEGMWDTDIQQPIALACFNPYGPGEKDLIFVAGMVYEFEMDSAEASYEGITLSSGHDAARYGYKQVFETDKIWPRSEKCYYGEKNDETDNIWIGTVSVGNFMNDPNGGEQIVFEHGRKRDDKNEYRHDLVIVRPDGSGGLRSDYKCINNDPSTAYRSNIDFAAIDYDDDGMLMKFKSKSAYFSDPSVVAVLQAAPYFADLEQIEPDYIEDGETVFGQTSGSGTSTTNGFSVTASAVTGYTQETSFLGLVKLGGGEWTVEVAASMGADFESATEVSYSTEYTSDSREDRVVLSMTPYIRYVYDMYIPEFTIPTKEEYDSTMANLTETEAEQYEEEVMAAIDSGYSWGDTVPAGTTEYVVCMPKTPRMSMIEVSTYDKVAEANGYEKIRGNVLNETIGNPATYPYTSSGLENFDGGKDVVGENADVGNDNFIWVSKGGGSVTQSIEVTESDSKSITWGTALSTSIQTDIAGCIIGGGVGADYTGSHTWSNYSSTVCSGTVAGIPADAVDLGYEFKWRFGQWKDKLNNEECIVLGYLVNEVNAPPYAPLNLTVKDTTDTTVTLNWKHPSSMGTNYEIYLVTDNPSSPYYRLATVPSSTTEYVVTGLSPNTNYDFMMRSINETKTSAFTVPVTGRTRYSADDNVPVTQPVADRYAVAGSDPSFEVTVTPAQGGGDVTYQWQRLETDGSVSSWTDIAGETNNTLTLNDVDKSMDGNMYRCTIAQFVNGNVAYVYTNAATLYVGTGETETTLIVEPGYGTAAGSYQVGTESETEVERDLTVMIGSSEYDLSKDESDGYIITLNGDGEAQYMYIPTESGKEKLEEAVAGNSASVTLEASDVKPLTGVFEYVDEEGVSTGITEDAVMVDETGIISAAGAELEYSRTYTDGNKKLYAVVTTHKEENADGSVLEKTSTEYYYDADTTDPLNEIISVSSEQTGYSDGENEYSFSAAVAVTVMVTETETVYETQNVEADPVTVTATVESLSSGVTVTPNGIVEFTFRNNDTGIETKQRVLLPENSGTNTNTVSHTWTPSVAGSYTITARYIESVELMSSVSNEGSYTAYAITSDKGSQVQRSLVFGCSDSILIGEEIDMKPTLQETTVADNGSEITDISVVPTELEADQVTYSVTLEYGDNAEGRYVFKGNVFRPSQPGSYKVTAEYKYMDGEGDSASERTISTSKMINVRSSAQNIQQQIFFAYSSLTKNVTDTNIINPLTNPNAGATVEFSSSNEKVAAVAQDGTVTPVGAGTTTITAVSKLEGKDDVSASYLLTIRKASVTITAPDITVTYGMTQEETIEKAEEADPIISGGLKLEDITDEPVKYSTSYKAGDNVGRYPLSIEAVESDKYEVETVNGSITVEQKILAGDDFDVTAQNKVYNASADAVLSASVKEESKFSGDNVTVEVTGAFEDVNAGEGKNVNYSIVSLGGTNSSNYALKDGSVTGTVKADITKAPVTITVIPKTTYIYDGTAKNVVVNGYANNTVFTDFNVKYDRGVLFPAVSEAVDAGEYDVDIELNDTAKNNYEIVGYDEKAKLIIVKGEQDVFSIEGIPDNVSYGDTVTLSAPDADGDVSFAVTGGDAVVNGDQLTFTGVGIVTVTATSSSENYDDKTVTKQINVQRRELIPNAVVAERAYDGTVNVDVEMSFENIVSGDEEQISATAIGTMINADAGNNKIVYISGITINGDKSGLYALSTQNIQSTVNITPLEITDFVVRAFDKTYDGTDAADTEVTDIVGVLDGDVGEVNILGTAVFDSPDAGEEKTVIFHADRLSGSASGNYVLSKHEAESTADISPMTIIFRTGAASFVYDGLEKSIEVSAFDSSGEIFEDYTVEYYNSDGTLLDYFPVDSGVYTVRIALNDSNNYTASNTELTMNIMQGTQEQISIIGLPGLIEYSDVFELETIGGSGNGEVRWYSDSDDVTVEANEDNTSKATVSVNGSVGERVTITAVKEDDGNYEEKETKIVFVPAPKTLTFIIGDLLQTYDGEPKSVSITPSVEEAQYTVTYNGTKDAPAAAGTYTVQVIGTGNYTGNATATLVISKAEMGALDISMDDWTYGDDANEPVYVGAPEGVEVKISYSTVDGQKPVNAGQYTVYAEYSGSNYETYVARDEFEIKKRTLTVTAEDATRSYGEENPKFILTYEGFADGEGVENLISVPAVSTTATSDSPVSEGGYPIEPYGGNADNYVFVYKNGTLSIVGASGGNFYIGGANNNAKVGDIFTLRAYYNDRMPQVKWESSDESVAVITETGRVMALKSGKAVITATVTDSNYASGISATFELDVSAKNVILTPQNLVLTYNGKVQGITFSSDTGEFVPVLEGPDKNIEITYTLKTDPSVTEPKNAGEYTVTYSITDPSYTAGGTAQLNINKAAAEIKANDIEKVYGDENPEYTFTGLLEDDMQDPAYIEKIKEMFAFASGADSAGAKAGVGVYPITVSLKEGKTLSDDVNYNFTISEMNGSLTVKPRPLTVNVSDAVRAYGESNVDPSYTYDGFVNGDTEENLTNKPVFTYAEGITEATDAGVYPNVITASGAESNNYAINYSYANGAKAAALTITKATVTVSGGTSRNSYLTINFDKAIPNLSNENFDVKLNGNPVEITEVTAGNQNQSYKLSGRFNIGKTYTVTVTVGDNYELSGSIVSVTPKSSGGGGGGGGGGNVSADISYTVNFETNGGSEIASIKVEKDNAAVMPEIPVREGYTFAGWFTDRELTEEYDFDKNVTKDITLYAKWNKSEETEPETTPQPEDMDEWTDPFIDVEESDWFYDAVKEMNMKGIFSGITADRFAPDENITRAMAVTVLWRMDGESDAKGQQLTFNDIDSQGYYSDAVRWGASNGIVIGYSDISFGPDRLITREEFATIMKRYAEYKDIDTSETGDLSGFADAETISEWAVESVSWAVGYGLISGKNGGIIDPKGLTTRAEAAAMLQRFIKK